jgi:hypothetical protein
MQEINESEKAGMLRSNELPCDGAMRTITAELRQTGAGSSSLAQSSLITSSMQSCKYNDGFEKCK